MWSDKGRGTPVYWDRMVSHKSNKDGPAIVLSDDRTIKSNDLERMWNETVVFFFWILFCLLPEGTEENHVTPDSITNFRAQICARNSGIESRRTND